MEEEYGNAIELLKKFADEKHLSWTRVAQMLGVTQNTLTNWKKGRAISRKNVRLIMELIARPDAGCSNGECPFRNTEDPIMTALFHTVAALSQKGRALVYMYALELHEGGEPRLPGFGPDDRSPALNVAERNGEK